MELLVDNNKKFSTDGTENIFSTFKKNQLYLVHHCGGKGTCGKCKVRVVKGEYESSTYGRLETKERDDGIVLSCVTTPKSDLVLETLKESRLVVGSKIAISKIENLLEYLKSYNVEVNTMVKRIHLELSPPSIDDNISDLERLKRTLTENSVKPMSFSYGFVSTMSEVLRSAEWKVDMSYVENDCSSEAIYLTSPRDCNRRYGIAVDIGTTTVVVSLVNMITGELIGSGSTYNSQIRYGDDVITRIVFATDEGGLTELREAIVSDINTITDSLLEMHDIGECEIESAVISANTTMSHIFWELNPASIREEPYIPTFNNFPLWRCGTAELSVNPQSPVYTVPCVGSYVGGDIVAGVLASKMHRNEEIALFMDIGTNGEIVVGNNEWLMTAACSAGPCFEGGGIKCGMRATEGAIESVKIDRETFEITYSVIGENVSPIGICGSGMIDAVSEMFLAGIIDQKGNFVSDKTDRIREGEEGAEYLFYKDESGRRDVVLTKVDIENLLRAKAAIYAGVSLLLVEVGLTVDAIEKVYIAGGFGNYLNIEKAKIIGMIPDMPGEKYVFLGNTSLVGAYLCLLSNDLRQEAEEIGSKMTYLELSVAARYMDEYMSAMFLPHTDLNQFPTISAMLNK